MKPVGSRKEAGSRREVGSSGRPGGSGVLAIRPIAPQQAGGAGKVLAHAYFPPPNGATAAGDAHFASEEDWINGGALTVGSFMRMPDGSYFCPIGEEHGHGHDHDHGSAEMVIAGLAPAAAPTSFFSQPARTTGGSSGLLGSAGDYRVVSGQVFASPTDAFLAATE